VFGVQRRHLPTKLERKKKDERKGNISEKRKKSGSSPLKWDWTYFRRCEGKKGEGLVREVIKRLVKKGRGKWLSYRSFQTNHFPLAKETSEQGLFW